MTPTYGHLSELQDPLVLGMKLLQSSLSLVPGRAQGGAQSRQPAQGSPTSCTFQFQLQVQPGTRD